MFSLAERLKLIASGEGKAKLFNFAQKLSLVLLTTSLSSFLSFSPAHATTYYVSVKGNGTNPTTWAGAWTGPSQVNDNVLQPGDTLIFDGGPGGMVYNGTLRILYDNLTVQKATDAGRNGQVIFDGQGNTPIGIAVFSNNVTVSGNTLSGFLVRNYSEGIRTDALATGISVSNVEVTGCRVGLEVGGGASFRMVLAHDNILQAIQRQANDTASRLFFQSCAFYNTSWPKAGTYSCGFESYLNVAGNVVINHCIFGPGLTHGIYLSSLITAKITNVLMLNATNTNFYEDARPAEVDLEDATFYMTATDPYGFAHSEFLAWQYPAKLQVRNSVIEAGVIQMPLLKFGQNNFQWLDTGNLTALDDRQRDPQFFNDVANIPSNSSCSVFMNTSYALKTTSQATGSDLTSFAQLIEGH
jgi:hypothetical protein